MISESVYWKEELARWASHLAKRRRAKSWTERSHARVEKAAMLGFFAIRRLIESGGRLSDATINMPVRLHAYPRQSDYMASINSQKVDVHFDLEKPKCTTVPLSVLANQFIHSHVFMLVQRRSGGLESILVTSDRGRHKECLEVSVSEIVRAFRQASRDYPTSVSSRYDPGKKDFVFYDVA
jgi:hypothetical protein